MESGSASHLNSTDINKRRPSRVGDIFRVSSGNFLEMYDFMIFGYYASDIGRTFFPVKSEFASLMLSLATFGAGFLMRPLGAFILGSYIDRQGRRKGLLLTLFLMSLGTLSVACVPGYQAIGLAAPLLVLLGRLVQGFSAGVELGGVSVYLSEIATPGNKGFFVSWQSCSQQVAVVAAAAFGLLVTVFLSKSQMDDWGWRIPLLLGCLIVPFLFWIRSSLRETETFLQKSHHNTPAEIFKILGQNWKVVTLGMMMVTMTTVSFYLITAYTPTFAGRVLHLSPKDALKVTFCVGLSNFFWLPVMGALSDRLGRRPLLILFSVLALLTAYPATVWLVHQPSFGRLLAVELWLSFIYASYNGAMVVYLTELMPLRVRTSGFSLAYSLATALFGGFTPAISTYLIHATQNEAMPGAWLSICAALALVSLVMIRHNGFKATEF